MKTIFKILILLTFVGIIFSLPSPAYAQGLSCEKLVLGGSYTLNEGETLDGDLCILGGSANTESGSTVDGDVIAVGGTLIIDGAVSGSLFTAGGTVILGETSTINGDVNILGGQVSGVNQAQIGGEVNENFELPLQFNFPGEINVPRFEFNNPFWDLFWLPLRSFLWAIAAVLAVLFIHKPFQRIGNTAFSQPVLSGGMGCSTLLVGTLLAIAMGITIICLPFSLLLGLVVLFAWAVGMIGLGLEVGERLAGLAKQQWAPAVSAGLGIFLVTLVINGIALAVPCIGWIGQLLAGAIGLGAVILTRFGTQSYPMVTNAPVPAPVLAVEQALEQPIEPVEPAAPGNQDTDR